MANTVQQERAGVSDALLPGRPGNDAAGVGLCCLQAWPAGVGNHIVTGWVDDAVGSDGQRAGRDTLFQFLDLKAFLLLFIARFMGTFFLGWL